MSGEFWAIIITGGLTILGSLAVQIFSHVRMRGEFGAIMRNFPPHRHVNGNILYPADYEPVEIERPH